MVNYISFQNLFRFAVIALTAWLLYWINFVDTTTRSLEQNRYEAWLQEVENVVFAPTQAPKTSAPIADLADVTVSIATQIDQSLLKWRVSTDQLRSTPAPSQVSEEPSADSRMLRILGLIRESNLFSLPQTQSAEIPALELEVTTKQGKFKQSFALSSIDKNVPAQLLLKLLQIYATTENGTQVALVKPGEIENEGSTGSVSAAN